MSTLPFKTHPAADVWPIMFDEELDALAEDIKVNGQRLPIYVDINGQVVDGRNRFLACIRAGIEPKMEDYWPGDHGPVEAFITSHNQHRRHMSRDDRNAVMQKMRDSGRSTHEIAQAVGVDQSTVVRNTIVPSDANASVSTDDAFPDEAGQDEAHPKTCIPKLRPPRKPQAKRLNDDEKKQIEASTKPIRQVAKDMGVAVSTVQEVKKASKRKVNDDQRKTIVDDFKRGFTVDGIAEQHQIHRDNIIKILKDAAKDFHPSECLCIFISHIDPETNVISGKTTFDLINVFPKNHHAFYRVAESCRQVPNGDPIESIETAFAKIRSSAIDLSNAMAGVFGHLKSTSHQFSYDWIDSWKDLIYTSDQIEASIEQYIFDHPSEKSEGDE